MSLPKLVFEVWPEFPFISERLAIRDFSRLSCQRMRLRAESDRSSPRFFMEEFRSRRCSDGRSGLPAEGDAFEVPVNRVQWSWLPRSRRDNHFCQILAT